MPLNRTVITSTELTTSDRYTAVYTTDTVEMTDPAVNFDTTASFRPTSPNRLPVTGYTDTEDTVVTDYDTADTTSYHKPDTTTAVFQKGTVEHTATLSTRGRSTTTTAISRRPTAEVDMTDTPRTKKMTTTTIPTSKFTTNYYPQSAITEQDLTTFYDENNMPTDFDYNFTSFAIPVTDRVPTAIDRSCASFICLNGGRCERSKTGHKVSFLINSQDYLFF